MKKELFNTSDITTYICKKCGSIVQKKYVSYRYALTTGEIAKCRACDFQERHKEFVLPVGMNYDSYQKLLKLIFNQGVSSLNQMENILDIDAAVIHNVIRLLNIQGKKFTYTLQCEYCSKPYDIPPSQCFPIHKSHYCSNTCYHNYKKENPIKGKCHPQYNRKSVNCSYCGKECHVPLWKTNRTNKEGVNHIYCSQACCWNHKKIYYRGQRSNFSNYKPPTEVQMARMNKAQEALRSKICNGSILNSKPQLIVDGWLQEMNIDYKREYQIGNYYCDNYLSQYKLVIEVMGDYWHANPLYYNHTNINAVQCKDIKNDKDKALYIKKHLGCSILYLWETDINQNPLLCKTLIQKYITNNLSIFHSYRYELLTNNTLRIKNTLKSIQL